MEYLIANATIQQGDKKSHIPTCKIKTVYPVEDFSE